MNSKSIILEKLKNIDYCLDRIESKVRGNIEQLELPDIEDIFVLNLQRTTQSAIDIAAIIFKEKSLPLPSTLKEYFLVLGKEEIIEKDLAQKLSKMAGFRNIAVHSYETLDPQVLKSIYKKGLKDLTDFKKAILKIL